MPGRLRLLTTLLLCARPCETQVVQIPFFAAAFFQGLVAPLIQGCQKDRNLASQMTGQGCSQHCAPFHSSTHCIQAVWFFRVGPLCCLYSEHEHSIRFQCSHSFAACTAHTEAVHWICLFTAGFAAHLRYQLRQLCHARSFKGCSILNAGRQRDATGKCWRQEGNEHLFQMRCHSTLTLSVRCLLSYTSQGVFLAVPRSGPPPIMSRSSSNSFARSALAFKIMHAPQSPQWLSYFGRSGGSLQQRTVNAP